MATSDTLAIKEKSVPTWAYIYCGSIVCSSLLCLIAKDRLQRSYQPAGEILDATLAICVFLIAYDVVEFEYEKLISTGAFLLTFAWSYHAHRQFLDYQTFKQDLHRIDRELDVELQESYGEDYEPSYSFDDTEKKARIWFAGVLVLVVLVLSPYLYVYLLSIGVFNQ